MQPLKSLRFRSRSALQRSELVAHLAYAAGAAPRIAASGAPAGYHSQIAQDYFLDRHVFAGRTGGTFVDVGAHDGETFSNSLFFESERDWTGVCIEPHPEAFARLSAARRATCVQTAIAPEPGRVPFVIGSGDEEMLSGLASGFDQRRRDRVDHDGSADVIEVEARRLDEVLTSAGIRHVDLLSIDVEGGELGVLRSIDLRSFGMPVVVMENNYRSWQQVKEMRRRGYQMLCRLAFDEVFIPADARIS